MAKIAKDISSVLNAQLEKFEERLDKELGEEVGKAVVEEILNLTSKGITPIAPGGRFPAYKDPSKYPGNRYPGKKPRPVNLRLTGDFMSALTHKVFKSGKSLLVEVGFYNKEFIKEQGHREGAGGQPKRPIIPIKSESFSQKILATVISVINKRFK